MQVIGGGEDPCEVVAGSDIVRFVVQGKAIVITGESVNVSGSGILITFCEEPDIPKTVWLEIVLPEPYSKKVSCISRVIRQEKEGNDNHTIAFHFEKIRPEDRDDLISYCLDQNPL